MLGAADVSFFRQLLGRRLPGMDAVVADGRVAALHLFCENVFVHDYWWLINLFVHDKEPKLRLHIRVIRVLLTEVHVFGLFRSRVVHDIDIIEIITFYTDAIFVFPGFSPAEL